ncbi:hypothetical protein LINGRAHAP2_LOCUS4550, partial [Linum grandiflorum]
EKIDLASHILRLAISVSGRAVVASGCRSSSKLLLLILDVRECLFSISVPVYVLCGVVYAFQGYRLKSFERSSNFAIWKIKMKAILVKEKGWVAVIENWPASTSDLRKEEIQKIAQSE